MKYPLNVALFIIWVFFLTRLQFVANQNMGNLPNKSVISNLHLVNQNHIEKPPCNSALTRMSKTGKIDSNKFWEEHGEIKALISLISGDGYNMVQLL
jgi:hypothetical protein